VGWTRCRPRNNTTPTPGTGSNGNTGKPEWWELVEPGKLDQELRRRLLERLIKKTNVVKASMLYQR